VPTSVNTGSARCELREMAGPNGAEHMWWGFGSVTHTLTCTLSCDPTAASPRKECIVGQIHARDTTPPLVLSVEMNSSPGTLAAFVRGTRPRRHELLPGLWPDTVFTYRIQVTGGRCRLWVATGDVTALPATPTRMFGAQDLGDPGECYFKAGAYNKSPIRGGSGRSVVRMFRLDLE
jgi:Alginate lyase